jgi:hypothetical protein
LEDANVVESSIQSERLAFDTETRAAWLFDLADAGIQFAVHTFESNWASAFIGILSWEAFATVQAWLEFAQVVLGWDFYKRIRRRLVNGDADRIRTEFAFALGNVDDQARWAHLTFTFVFTEADVVFRSIENGDTGAGKLTDTLKV